MSTPNQTKLTVEEVLKDFDCIENKSVASEKALIREGFVTDYQLFWLSNIRDLRWDICSRFISSKNIQNLWATKLTLKNLTPVEGSVYIKSEIHSYVISIPTQESIARCVLPILHKTTQ